jgi:hypothetical protein
LFKIKPTCINCKKEINGGDLVYIKMRYPQGRGFTEIKAYLRNEGQIICNDCYHQGEKAGT